MATGTAGEAGKDEVLMALIINGCEETVLGHLRLIDFLRLETLDALCYKVEQSQSAFHMLASAVRSRLPIFPVSSCSSFAFDGGGFHEPYFTSPWQRRLGDHFVDSRHGHDPFGIGL
jgi:hypothetical protein